MSALSDETPGRETPEPTSEQSPEQTAGRQYALGLLNRRVVRHVENLDCVFSELDGRRGAVTLLCACGREGCRESVTIPLAAYEGVRASPHRFLVAAGHAAEIDRTVERRDGYEIVEIKPEFRQSQPPTLDG